MVKFQRQLEAERVPEWRKAYCKYKHLKNDLKRIKRVSLSTGPQRHVSETPAFSLSALARRRTTVHPTREQAIQVSNLNTSGSEDLYETKLLEDKLADDSSVRAFFRRLDGELNKVNKFYRSQEEEFMERAQQLDKQITTLLQLKTLVKEQDHVNSNRKESVTRRSTFDIRGSTDNTHESTDSSRRSTDYSHGILPGQTLQDRQITEERINQEIAIDVMERRDLGLNDSSRENPNDSGGDVSVDRKKSVEELTETSQTDLENGETNDNMRNEEGAEYTDDEDENLQPDQAVTEQEEVFISNEQELPSDSKPFEGLIISPAEDITKPQASKPQGGTEIATHDIEEAKNVETASSTVSTHSSTDEVVDEHTLAEQVSLPRRRETVVSVVQDMEHQVEEAKLRATRAPPRVNINMPVTTPVATISAISQILWEDILQQMRKTSWDNKPRNGIYLSKKKLNYAEKVLYKALVEFYRGLGLLKSYSSLNMLAFAKILKKFDKTTDECVAPIYLKAVENSYFVTSNKVVLIMERVEKLFTEYFEGNNRRKAMEKLRPMERKASHRVSFFVGVFSGASVALVVVLCIIAPITLWRYKAGGKSGQRAYYETVFPLFSMVGLILLHMYMWSCDIYLWCSWHINYVFIFEFAPGKVLRYREMFFICTSLTCLYLGIMVGHFAGHYSKQQPSMNLDFLPMTVVLFFLLLLFCPFNIIYRSSRFFFLRSLLHVIFAPLYKVVLADFFLADQLTSQVPVLRQFEWVLCYYFGGYYKHGNGKICSSNVNFRRTIYFVSLLPYWFRAAQCIRRYVDEGGNAHIANFTKYFSALIAMALRVDYSTTKKNNTGLMVMTIFWSVIATTYQLYWDLVVDWGLLQRKSRNPWLRDTLILHEYKYIYFVCMVLDAVLRLAWLQSVARWQLGNLDSHMTEFIFSGLEIIRRGIWNFFRIENEHLNNIGKFRAVMHVPLPFEELRTSEES